LKGKRLSIYLHFLTPIPAKTINNENKRHPISTT